MNQLHADTRALILSCLMDGMSVRATCRVTGAAKRTVLKLLLDAGTFARLYQDFRFRNLPITDAQCDEQWSFVGAKQRNAKHEGQGDIWVFAGMDSNTKLLFSHLVGARNPENTYAFVKDMASRTTERLQLSSDGWQPYMDAVRLAFPFARCDYAQVQKTYGQSEEALRTRRYSPPICTGMKKIRMIGKPDMETVSTSHIERINLNTRQNCRRMTRLTNGFSRKHENHSAALALTFFGYNYCKTHRTLTTANKGIQTTPAMAAGLAWKPWTALDMITMMDANQQVGKAA